MFELRSRSFVGREPGPHLLITGGVHGDEWEPMAACRRLIARFRNEPPIRGRISIVPVVNEPAFCRGSRIAEDGLDLARTCPGRADGSITEQIAFAISEQIRTADFFIDLHTGGTRYRLLPMVGYTLHPDAKVLESQRRMARAFGLPIIWGTDPNLDGRTLSMARDAGVPAIYAEYLGGGTCDPDGIAVYEHGCLAVAAEIGLVTGRVGTAHHFPRTVGSAHPTKPGQPLLIEDPRPNSGHLQRNHPAPSAGFFEPAVTLGQTVTTGELLGTVTDLLGDVRHDIRAQHDGIVLCLHTFARVEAGVGLVVILETESIRSRS